LCACLQPPKEDEVSKPKFFTATIKNIFSDYKKICFTLKARRKRVPEEGYHNHAMITPQVAEARAQSLLVKASGQASEAVSRNPS